MQGLALHLVDDGFIDCSSLGSFVFPLFTLQPEETRRSFCFPTFRRLQNHAHSMAALLSWHLGCWTYGGLVSPWLHLAPACLSPLSAFVSRLCSSLDASCVAVPVGFWLMAAAVSFAWFELLLQPPLPSLVLLLG